MSTNKPVQLGLCCLNITLKNLNPPIYHSRKIIKRIIVRDGMDELKRRILLNLQDLIKMILWNEENGIKVFRLSSELFPHKSNKEFIEYDFEFAKSYLKEIGELSRSLNQRLTFHPGQYNVLGTPFNDKLKKTIDDLTYHAEVLELMGMGKDSVIVIHGGGLYGNKELTKHRWCDNYNTLEANVRDRVVLENCERMFSIKDCLDISNECGVPIVFDTHHFECYKLLQPKEEFESPEYYIPLILETWKKKNIKPKFHVSEQKPCDVREYRCGCHSDYIETIPKYLLEIPDKYDTHIDIIIEAKKKELAIFKLYKKYPFLNCKKRPFKINMKINIT